MRRPEGFKQLSVILKVGLKGVRAKLGVINLEVAIDKGCRLVGINLNNSRFKDYLCPSRSRIG